VGEDAAAAAAVCFSFVLFFQQKKSSALSCFSVSLIRRLCVVAKPLFNFQRAYSWQMVDLARQIVALHALFLFARGVYRVTQLFTRGATLSLFTLSAGQHKGTFFAFSSACR
jgi:hypothetical protein